jgi:hypothetical protein
VRRVPLSKREKGWRQLDRALNAAGWALDHKFATGSENGQPMSPAYDWNGPVADRKYQFKNPGDAAKKIKKTARFLGASLVGIARYNPLWTYSRLVKENLENDPDEQDKVKFDLIKPEFPFTPKSVVVIAVEMDYKAIALSDCSFSFQPGRGRHRVRIFTDVRGRVFGLDVYQATGVQGLCQWE